MFETVIVADAALALLRRWVTDGAVVPLVVLWIGLCNAEVLVQKALRRAVHGEFLVQIPVSYHVIRRVARLSPLRPLQRQLPAFERGEYGSYSITGTGPGVFAQVALLHTLGVLFEEGLTRGLPLVAALLLGVDPVWFVGAGTLLWAFLHGMGRAISLTLTVGWFLAALWLTGHWELAVGLHLANNLTVLCVLWYPFR